jgi:hypothetical protein
MKLILLCVVVGVADVLLLAGQLPTFPYIFLSCGRGRCYNRLANLDHKLQVLLIEGGESNLNNPWVYRPGICESALRKKIH